MEPSSLVSLAIGALLPLYNIITSLAGASQEAADMTSYVRKLIEVMTNIRNGHLSRASRLPAHLEEQLVHVSNDCYSTATVMSARLSNSGKGMSVAGRCKWVFNKSETLRHKTQLEAYFDIFRALQVAILDNNVDNLSDKVDALEKKLDLNLQILARLVGSQIAEAELSSYSERPGLNTLPTPAMALTMAPAQTWSCEDLVWSPSSARNEIVKVPWQRPVESSGRSQVSIRYKNDNDDRDDNAQSSQTPRFRDELLDGTIYLVKRGYEAYKRHQS